MTASAAHARRHTDSYCVRLCCMRDAEGCRVEHVVELPRVTSLHFTRRLSGRACRRAALVVCELCASCLLPCVEGALPSDRIQWAHRALCICIVHGPACVPPRTTHTCPFPQTPPRGAWTWSCDMQSMVPLLVHVWLRVRSSAHGSPSVVCLRRLTSVFVNVMWCGAGFADATRLAFVHAPRRTM